MRWGEITFYLRSQLAKLDHNAGIDRAAQIDACFDSNPFVQVLHRSSDSTLSVTFSLGALVNSTFTSSVTRTDPVSCPPLCTFDLNPKRSLPELFLTEPASQSSS